MTAAVATEMHTQWAPKFWARVDKNGPIVRAELGPCWLWTGSRLPRGYGRFYPKNHVALYAHRVSLEMAEGKALGPGEEACHHCDNPPCVRPEHLFRGTKSKNMQDCLEKGRWGDTALRGEEHPAHRLTEAQVLEIRAQGAAGARHRELARRYGVSRALISTIIRGEAWAHLLPKGGLQ